MRFFNQIIKRPVATIAILIAIVSLGARALIGLESGVDPALGRPAISISVRYSGASPAVVEREVVRPIERRIAGIRGIVRTEAMAREDQGRVAIYFDFASDLHRAFQAIHDSVAVVRRELPNHADEPVISQGDRGGSAAVSLDSDAPGRRTMPAEALRLTLVLGTAFALLAFLCVVRSWRSALVVALSVSTTALGTAAAAGLLGLSLTPMMLLGLALAIGLAIDDVIVVRESIVRQAELGSDLPAALARGTRAMAGALVVGVLTTIGLFAPLASAGGTAGSLLAAASLTVVVGVIASAVVSMTVVPALSRIVSSPASETRRKTIARLARLDYWFDGLTDRYHERLAWSLSHRVPIAVVGALALALIVGVQASSGRAELISAPNSESATDSSGAGTSASVDLALLGPDSRTLLGVAQHVADEARRVDGVTSVVVSTTARSDSEGPAQIDHLNGERVITLHARTKSGSARDVNREVIATIAATPLPPGYRVMPTGGGVERREMIARLGIALSVALVLVYIVLAARWRSLVEPVTVMVAIPLTLVGVVGALLVSRASLDLFGLIGAAFTAALCVRYTVPVMDAARRRRTQGLSVRVALIEAARQRFRPIVVAAVVLVAWLAPLAFVGGEALGAYRALGVAALGGTLASVLVTLFVVPALSATVSDVSDRVRSWKPAFRQASPSALPLEPGD